MALVQLKNLKLFLKKCEKHIRQKLLDNLVHALKWRKFYSLWLRRAFLDDVAHRLYCITLTALFYCKTPELFRCNHLPWSVWNRFIVIYSFLGRYVPLTPLENGSSTRLLLTILLAFHLRRHFLLMSKSCPPVLHRWSKKGFRI